jgi:hypothetical protein
MAASDKAYAAMARIDALVARVAALETAGMNRASGTLSPNATFAAVPGVNATLTVATWHITGVLMINPTASGGTLTYRAHAPGSLAVSGSRIGWIESTTSSTLADFVALDATFGGANIGAGLANRFVIFDGSLAVTTGGTVNIQVALSSGSATVLQLGSYIEATMV